MTRIILAVCLVLTGCAMTKPVQMTKAFNAAEAQNALRRGTNIIRGSALIRQAGGGVVTCAGSQVDLVPATEYATERMMIYYKSVSSGYLPAEAPNVINPPSVPATTDAQYTKLARLTTCDAQGFFSFSDVADGSYYLITSVVWRVGYNVQGGALMKRVDLQGGSPIVEVVLTP